MSFYIQYKKQLQKVLPKKVFNFFIFLWRNTVIKFLYAKKNQDLNPYNEDTKNVFDRIYKNNLWWSHESVSGPWSEYNNTKNIRKWIYKIIKDYKIKTFIDAPCWDTNWIEPENMNIPYIWCDIVEDLIFHNTSKFKENPDISFRQLDITRDSLPQWDLILCRECLQHLSYSNIFLFIKNLKKSNIKYILTTTHNSSKNINIKNWNYFEINLQLPPFSFPKPLIKIEELERNKITWEEKFLALWDISKL